MPTGQPPSRRPRRRVDGVLLLDKPAGLSSNAALQRAKRIFGAEKAGHTGTLDPLATGLLPLCFGEATKFAQALLDSRKEYVATLRFGNATTTGDAEGEVIGVPAAAPSRAAFEAILPRYIGRVMQLPPLHSALKFKGRNYYEYARAGVEIPRVPRAIDIYGIEVIDWSAPHAVLHVVCGKGTYIRVLAEDLAGAAGSCAHLTALRRIAAGPFTIDGAVTLEVLEAMDGPARDALLLPADALLSAVDRLDVDAPTARALAEGRVGSVPPETCGTHRCYGPGGRFIGLVECSGGTLRALRLSRTDAPAAPRGGDFPISA